MHLSPSEKTIVLVILQESLLKSSCYCHKLANKTECFTCESANLVKRIGQDLDVPILSFIEKMKQRPLMGIDLVDE